MFRALCNKVPRTRRVVPSYVTPTINQARHFWEFVNMKFNEVDTDRVKKFGPDRTCAEWVLRNGGKVVWSGGQKLADYNLLPPEKTPVPKLIEIDGSDSSISHYGFPHLIGCTMISKIILHNNDYIDDRALKGLSYARNTLNFLQVSKCNNVTDAGLKSLTDLVNLQNLVLFHLISVEKLQDCLSHIQKHLPKCKISTTIEVSDGSTLKN